MRTPIHRSALLIVFALGCSDDGVPDASEDAGSEDVDAQEVDAQEVDARDTGGPDARDSSDVLLGGEVRVLAMDSTGVVFSSVLINGFSIELAAIQTDGLPPPMSVCVEDGCNAHRDRWVRPTE